MDSPISLVACGSNNIGQLGIGDLEDHHSFTASTFSGYSRGITPSGTTRILDLVFGAGHTMVLLERKDTPSGALTTELWGCGDGRRGQLGTAEWLRQTSSSFLAGDSSTFRPVDLSGDKEVYDLILRHKLSPKLIAAAWETSFIVFGADGCEDVVLSMGANDWGCLGVGDQNKTSHNGIGRIVDLSPWKSGEELFRIVNIKAGQSHVILQLQFPETGESNREIFLGWGKSRQGQLGGEYQSDGRSSQKQGGRKKTLSYLDKPRGVHTSKTVDTKFALGAQHSVFLHSDGDIVGYGSNSKRQQALIQDMRDLPAAIIKNIDCTWNGTYICAEEKREMIVFASGGWEKGQLGKSDVTTSKTCQAQFPENVRPQFVVCGTEHVLACCKTGKDTGAAVQVWGWGWNEHGNLGTGNTEDLWTPRRIWPPPGQDPQGHVLGIWAGAATSWIAFERLHSFK